MLEKKNIKRNAQYDAEYLVVFSPAIPDSPIFLVRYCTKWKRQPLEVTPGNTCWQLAMAATSKSKWTTCCAPVYPNRLVRASRTTSKSFWYMVAVLPGRSAITKGTASTSTNLWIVCSLLKQGGQYSNVPSQINVLIGGVFGGPAGDGKTTIGGCLSSCRSNVSLTSAEFNDSQVFTKSSRTVSGSLTPRRVG